MVTGAPEVTTPEDGRQEATTPEIASEEHTTMGGAAQGSTVNEETSVVDHEGSTVSSDDASGR